MKKDSLTIHTLKNASYGLVGYLWPVIFTLLITPLVVFALGVEDYGVYVSINAISGMMVLLDLGISNAILKFAAEYHKQEQEEKLKHLIFSANTLFLALGLIRLVIFSIASLIVGAHHVAFIIAGIISFVESINSTYNIIPISLQRFEIGMKIGIFQLTFQNILLLALVLNGFGLVSAFVAQLVSVLLSFLMVRVAARRLLPWAKMRLGWHPEEIKKCYKFGLTTITNSVSASALNYLDRLLIPIFLGPAQLTYYSLPGNISSKIPGITNNLSSILFPLAASLSGSDNRESLRNAYIRSFRLLTVLIFAISISIIIFSYKILEIWLNKDFAEQSVNILIILTITNFLLALMGPLTNLLMGLGKMKLLTLTSLSMALINMGLLLVLIPKFGITGAAWAYLLALCPIFYLFYYTEKYYLEIGSRWKYYVRIILNNLLVSIIFYPIVHYAVLPLVKNLPSLVIAGPASVLIYLLLYLILGFFEREDVRDMKYYFSMILMRIVTIKQLKQN